MKKITLNKMIRPKVIAAARRGRSQRPLYSSEEKEIIYALQKTLKLSNRTIAHEIGVNISTYRKWLKNDKITVGSLNVRQHISSYSEKQQKRFVSDYFGISEAEYADSTVGLNLEDEFCKKFKIEGALLAWWIVKFLHHDLQWYRLNRPNFSKLWPGYVGEKMVSQQDAQVHFNWFSKSELEKVFGCKSPKFARKVATTMVNGIYAVWYKKYWFAENQRPMTLYDVPEAQAEQGLEAWSKGQLALIKAGKQLSNSKIESSLRWKVKRLLEIHEANQRLPTMLENKLQHARATGQLNSKHRIFSLVRVAYGLGSVGLALAKRRNVIISWLIEFSIKNPRVPLQLDIKEFLFAADVFTAAQLKKILQFMVETNSKCIPKNIANLLSKCLVQLEPKTLKGLMISDAEGHWKDITPGCSAGLIGGIIKTAKDVRYKDDETHECASDIASRL